MKNKIIAILLTATMIISLSACGNTETSNNDSNNKEVEDLENQIAELQKQLEEVQQGNTDNNNDSNNNSSASASINESTAETWGVCGADLTWYYENGTLVIRGTGDMTDNQPWTDIIDKIQWVYIEDGVTSIGSYAFENCKYISKVEMPNGVTTIGYGAFENCVSLTNVFIPSSIVVIGDHAFRNCTSLNNISISENVITIGQSAFGKCDNLKEVVINNYNIDLVIWDSAFEYGTKIIINENEYNWGDFERVGDTPYLGGIHIEGIEYYTPD